MTVIRIVRGDITKLNCCCIVNAANKELNPGGGLDGVIRAAAGPELDTYLREFRKTNPALAPNQAVCTKGYNLKETKYIIHCAAPDMRKKNTVVPPKKEDFINLTKSYIATLRIGSDYQLDHMAFPLLGGGIYGYPIELSFLTGIQSILAFLELHPNYEGIEDENEAEKLPQQFSFVMVTENAFETCKKLLNGQTEYTFNDPEQLRNYLIGSYFKNGPKANQDFEMFGKTLSLSVLKGTTDKKAPYFKGPFSPVYNQSQPTAQADKTKSLAKRLVKAIIPFSVQGTSRETAPSEERQVDSTDTDRTFERTTQQLSFRKRLQCEQPLEGTPPKRDRRQDNIPAAATSTLPEVSVPTLSAAEQKRIKETERKREYRARKSAEKPKGVPPTTPSTEEKRKKESERKKDYRARKSAEKQGLGSARKTSMATDEVRLRNNESHRQRRRQPIGRNLSFTTDDAPDRVFPVPHYLGPINVVCRFCNALHFKGKGGVCCNSGQVWLEQYFKDFPEQIQRLLNDADRHFIQNIVSYNSLLAMASIVYTKEPVGKFGIQASRVLGPPSHWPSALIPNPGSKPAFGNFYAFNAEEATEARMTSDVMKEWSAGIDEELLLSLTKCIEENHPLAKSYRMMHEVLKREERMGRDPGQMHMRIVDRYEAEEKGFDPQQHPGTYNVPVGKDYVCVFFTCRTDQKMLPRGLNVYRQLGTHKPVEIKGYMKVVDPLCYPLMFPHGEGLWEACRYPIQAEKRTFEEKMAEYNERMNTDSDRTASRVNLDDAQILDQTRGELQLEHDEDADEQYDEEEMRQMLNVDNDQSVSRPRITRIERDGEFYDVRNGNEEIPFVDGYMSDDSEAEVSDVEVDIDINENAEGASVDRGQLIDDEDSDLNDILDHQDRMREAHLNLLERDEISDEMVDNDVYIPAADILMDEDETIVEVNNQDNNHITVNTRNVEREDRTGQDNVMEEMEPPSDDEGRPQRRSRGFVSLREAIVFFRKTSHVVFESQEELLSVFTE